MLRTKSLAFGLCIAGCMLMLAGCGASEQRAQGRRLREDRDAALKLLERAVSLLSSPHYQNAVTGANNPFPLNETPKDANDIRLLGNTMNPEAVKALDEAENLLRNSLKENANGDPLDLGLTYSTLARVQAMKGDVQRAAAQRAQNEVQLLRGEIGTLRARMEARKTLLQRYNQFLSIPRKELESRRDEALAQAGEYQKKKDALDKKIADMRAEMKKQTDTFIKKEAEASSIRARSASKAGSTKKEDLQQAMKDVDAALSSQLAADDATAEAMRLEAELAIRTAESKELGVTLDMYKAIGTEAGKILDQRDRRDEDIRTREKKARQDIAAMQKQVAQMAEKMGQACQASAEAEQKAAKDYRDAYNDLTEAARKNPADASSPGMLASQGELQMKLATLYVRKFGFHARNMAFLDTLKKTWEAVQTGESFPEGFQKVESYIAKEGADTDLKLTLDYFDKSEALYKKAAAEAGSDLQWVYEGQLGAAYLGAYDATGKEEYLTKAKEVLEKARQGKAASPYLNEVNYLLKIAQK